MRNFLTLHLKTLVLLAVLLPLLGLFGYLSLRSGPLAPVPVTVAVVESRALQPALFGIGNVEARSTHKIGPTVAGRLKRVEVQAGDLVRAGQLLGEMDQLDLDEKIAAQDAAFKRGEAGVLAVEAQLADLNGRKNFAENQARRYEQLFAARAVSEEGLGLKRQELQVAQSAWTAARANLEAARQELARLRAEREGLQRQRGNLRLLAPIDGVISRREADPGSTVLAGQMVLEVVQPQSIWIHVRFDQQRAGGLLANLPAQIVLRSQGADPIAGRIERIEAHADPVTQETLAKVAFSLPSKNLPSIGELAEVTVALTPQAALPVVPMASIQRVDGRLGVWLVEADQLRFVAVKMGASDLEGRVQIEQGLSIGQRVVVYSQKALGAHSRIKIVPQIVGQSA